MMKPTPTPTPSLPAPNFYGRVEVTWWQPDLGGKAVHQTVPLFRDNPQSWYNMTQVSIYVLA